MPAQPLLKVRLMFARLYAAIVACDFIIFPIGHAAYQAYFKIAYTQWQPITLQGGGMLHLAMGAIIGVQMWHWRQDQNTQGQSS